MKYIGLAIATTGIWASTAYVIVATNNFAIAPSAFGATVVIWVIAMFL